MKKTPNRSHEIREDDRLQTKVCVAATQMAYAIQRWVLGSLVKRTPDHSRESRETGGGLQGDHL